MPKAEPKKSGSKKPDSTAAVKTESKTPKLVKGNQAEHPAVTKAKEKELPVQEQFEEMKEPVAKPNPVIEKLGIEKKKISRDKVALMAEENKLDSQIRELMKAEGLTHYKNNGVDIELVSTKDKLVIKIEDDEEN